MAVCVWEHLQLPLAARGPPKTSSEPRCGRGIVFRNSRISLSAGPRACEPAAKPAIPGVILVHNGFVWPERTLQPAAHHSSGVCSELLSCPLLWSAVHSGACDLRLESGEKRHSTYYCTTACV
jgi:hypothetical protein